MTETRRHRQVDHVIEPLIQSLFPCRAHDPWGRLRGRYRFALGQAREKTLALKIDPFKIDLPIYSTGIGMERMPISAASSIDIPLFVSVITAVRMLPPVFICYKL